MKTKEPSLCLVGQGIINGYEDGTLKPNASMIRGEVAKVLTVLR